MRRSANARCASGGRGVIRLVLVHLDAAIGARHLSREEQGALVEFMKALRDT
jgi:hypothetical protein